MKILDKFFLYIFLILQVNFFDLINIRNSFLNGWSSYSQKKLFLIFVFIYIFLRLILYNAHFNPKIMRRHFSPFIIFLLISVVILIFGTLYKFDQTLFATILIAYYFFILLLYFPFSEYLNTWENWRYIIRRFIIFSSIVSIIKLVQSYILLHFGKLIFYLNTNFDYSTALQRNFNVLGFTRIASSVDFVAFSVFIMLIYKAIKGAIFSKLKDNVILFFNVLFLICVGQSRGYLIIIVVIILSILLMRVLKSVSKSIQIFFLVLILLIAMVCVGILIDKVFFVGSRSISMSIRQYAYQYYLKNIFNNGWFAFGFARDDLYGSLIHGQSINYNGQIISANFDDVGIIGFLGKFGMLGVLNIIVFLWSSIQCFAESKYKQLSFLTYIFLFGCWISLSPFDSQRIFYLPIILVFLDFLTTRDKGEVEHI
ncbi:hypothetical protein [Companilactobacillus kimchiensis]|uniref:Polysaccharide polymerase n=1 Tax=Companilactobacillus kimchiensis TaxID=993692 RepID=A0A0R2LLI0_9LACO|nr:hypothetical protein [Companilactobacillus kimchiensis]KRO00386.1 hypothetical protein IV57_GL001490 [Companilactobacillus kimchiensis]